MATDLKHWRLGRAFLRITDGTTKYWYRGRTFVSPAESTSGSITGDASIASGEAFETDGKLSITLIGDASIASGEAFETNGSVSPVIVGDTSIPSAEAFETDGVLYDQISGDASIASGEAFETDGRLGDGIIGDASIASGEAFEATGYITGDIRPASIASTANVPAPFVGSILTGTTGISLQLGQGDDGYLTEGIAGTLSNKFKLRTGLGGSIMAAGTENGFFRIYIRGVDFTPYLVPNSLSCDIELNFTARANLTLSEHENAPNALMVLPQTTTTLAAGITAGTTSITVVNGSGMDSANFVAKIGNEYVYVVSRTGNTLLVNRGYFSSTAASHSSGASISQVYRTAEYVPPIPFFPVTGMPVEMWYYDGDYANLPHRTNQWYKIFAGQLNSVDCGLIADLNVGLRRFDIQCSDFNYTLQRRIIKQTYTAPTTLNTVLADFNTKYFIPEGLTLITAPVDVNITGDITFDNVPVNEALDRLCEITGYDRRVDFDRNVRIYDRPAAIDTAPYDLREVTVGADSNLWRELHVRETRGLYRNTQRIAGNYAVQSTTITLTYNAGLDESTPYFRQWQLNSITVPSGTWIRAPFLIDTTYDGQVQRVTDIKLNGVTQTFFTLGDTPPTGGYQWVVMGGNTIQILYNTLVDAQYWPQSGDVLTVSIEVAVGTPPPNLIQNTAEITNRQSIEGFGTGIYEAVEDFGTYDNADIVLQYAQALLDRFSVMGSDINFSTDVIGFEPGQGITVNLPLFNIASDSAYKIESLSWKEEHATLLRFTVNVSNAIAQRDAIAAFSRLIRRIRNSQKPIVDVAMFNLAVTSPGYTNPGLVTGTKLTNSFIVRQKAVTVKDIAIIFDANAAIADTPVLLRIKRNGVSITASEIPIPVGSAADTLIVFSGPWATTESPTLFEDDLLTIDCTQISTTTITNVTVTIRGSV